MWIGSERPHDRKVATAVAELMVYSRWWSEIFIVFLASYELR